MPAPLLLPSCFGSPPPGGEHGFTLLEVMVSVGLIALAMGSIVMTNISSAKMLRASRDMAAASQILQQRIEMVRDRGWSDVASSGSLLELLRLPTNSEAELVDSRLTETLLVTVPKASSSGLVETEQALSVRRDRGKVSVVKAGDFATERTLLFEDSVTWRDTSGVHERSLRTVVCRSGLTRSGIVGTLLGRPGTQVSTTVAK